MAWVRRAKFHDAKMLALHNTILLVRVGASEMVSDVYILKNFTKGVIFTLLVRLYYFNIVIKKPFNILLKLHE